MSADRADFVIEGRVEKVLGNGWRATLSANDEQGRSLGARELTSAKENCRSLDETLVLAIALMIDPDAEAREPQPSTPTGPVSSAPPVVHERYIYVREREVVVPAAVEPPSGAWSSSIRGGASLLALRTPTPVFGGVVAFELDPPSFVPLELAGGLWTEAETETRGRGTAMLFGGASLSLCPRIEKKPFRGSFCAGPMFGGMRVRGIGFDDAASRTLFLIDARAAARGEVEMTSTFFAAATVSGLVSLTPRHFVYANEAAQDVAIYSTPPLAAAFDIGIGARFR